MKRVEHIGNATLYLGDCLEIMPTCTADTIFADPPYGNGTAYLSYDDTLEGLKTLSQKWLPMARSIATRVCITPGNANMYLYDRPTWTMAWVTPAGAGSGPWGFSCWQPIMCYGPDPMLASGKGRRPDLIIHTEQSERNGHPCPKPERFMRRLIDRISVDADTVLDPFMGSGTTGVACAKLGRKFTGIELDPDYFDIACERIAKAYAQPDLFIEPQAKAVQESFKMTDDR